MVRNKITHSLGNMSHPNISCKQCPYQLYDIKNFRKNDWKEGRNRKAIQE